MRLRRHNHIMTKLLASDPDAFLVWDMSSNYDLKCYDENGMEVQVLWFDPDTKEYGVLLKDDRGETRRKWPPIKHCRYGDHYHAQILNDWVVETAIYYDAEPQIEIRRGRLFINSRLRSIDEIKQEFLDRLNGDSILPVPDNYEEELPARMEKIAKFRDEVIRAGWPEAH